MYRQSLVLLFYFLFFHAQNAIGQSEGLTPLFQSKEPLHIRANGSIKFIKKKTNDSTFNASKFFYESKPGEWTEVPIQARVRGNFRLKNCYFPPLKLKLHKQNVKSTLFAGNKALKLVVPCQNRENKNTLILKEYLCYQFYEALTPFHFNTRLVNLNLTETSKKNPRQYDLLCFFVEDNQVVAKRTNSSVVKNLKLPPGAFDDKHAARHDLFQYMIGNADWSVVYQHNSNALYLNPKYIPLSYDFDMSGFVDADYAQTNAPTLGTGDVRERVYRGFCKPEATMQEIRKEFLQLETTFLKIIDDHASQFDARSVKDMKEYLNQFFEILKDDNLFKSKILDTCRTDK
jgi:hypothetical protein